MKDREMDGLNEERIIAIPDSFSLLNSSFLLGIDLISNYNCIDEAIQSVIMMIGNEICFNNNDLQVIILSSKRETHFLFFSYFLNLMKEEKKIRYHISISQQAMGKEKCFPFFDDFHEFHKNSSFLFYFPTNHESP